MSDFVVPIDDETPELMPRGNGGGQMVPTETKIGDVVSMRRAAILMPRQPSEVRRLIAEAAEMFGDGFEYRFPVRNNKTGETQFIEGPTIGCTMAVARAYGNCDVAHTRTEDEGNSWVLYSTFLDLQSGFSLTRGFRQRKGQSRMGADRSRGEDIDFQIGVSKSTRNVVARALDDYVQYARHRARERLSGSIAKRPEEYRDRIKAYLAELKDPRTGEQGYPISAIEGALGSKLAKWSYEQIATVVRTVTAHKDGVLRDLDEVYRPRPDAPEAAPQSSAAEPAEAREAQPPRAREGGPPQQSEQPDDADGRRRRSDAQIISDGIHKATSVKDLEDVLKEPAAVRLQQRHKQVYAGLLRDAEAKRVEMERAQAGELGQPHDDEREPLQAYDPDTGEVPADDDGTDQGDEPPLRSGGRVTYNLIDVSGRAGGNFDDPEQFLEALENEHRKSVGLETPRLMQDNDMSIEEAALALPRLRARFVALGWNAR